MAMLCTIKKAFPFSRDGVTVIHAESGTSGVDIPGALTAALEAEGYLTIETSAAEPAEAEVTEAPAEEAPIEAADPTTATVSAVSELDPAVSSGEVEAPAVITGADAAEAAADTEKADLQAKAEALGIEVDGRWSVKTLTAKIAAAEAEAEDQASK